MATRNGGAITVFAELEGWGFFAELYASSDPDTLVLPSVGDGHCELAPFDALPNVIDRELDASLSASSPLANLIAQPTGDGLAEADLPQATYVDGSSVRYGAVDATTVAGFDTTWQLAYGGQALATITVPAQLTKADSQVRHLPGQSQIVQWTGGADAEYIELDLGADLGRAICYPPAGATSFVVPARVIDAIAAVDGSASVTVFAKNRAVVTIDGREVVVTGVSQNLD